MSYFTHLECSVPCGAPALDPRAHPSSLRLRRSAARPLRSRQGARLVARQPRRARAEHVALPRAAAAVRRRDAGDARRRVHAAVPRTRARRDARPRAPLHQGRIAQPDQLVQGARPVGGDHAREVPRREDDRAADGRQRRQRRGRLLRRRRPGVRGVHPEGRQAAVRRRVPALRRERHAGRRPDHRRRPHLPPKPAGRSAGTTSRRSRSRTASKARRRWPTSSPSRCSWEWPDWIIYPTGGGTGMVGMWKAFDEIERIGWVKPAKRPRMVSVQAEDCAPIVRAFEQGTEKAQPWENASTLADGLRVPRAIGDFLILRAMRESGGTALAVTDRSMVDGHARDRQARGRQRRAGGRRRARRDSTPGRGRLDQAAGFGGAVQYRRRAEVPRRLDR